MYAADPRDVAAIVVGLRKMMWAAIAFPLGGAALLYLDAQRNIRGPELSLLGVAGSGIAGPLLARAGLASVVGLVRASGGAAAVRRMPILDAAEGVPKAASIYCVFSSIFAVMVIVLILTARGGRDPGDGWMWALGMLGVLTGVSWMVRNGVFCVRSAEIAGRSNRRGMGRVFRAMVWMSGAGALAVVGYGVLGILFYVFRNDLLAGFTSGRRSMAGVLAYQAGTMYAGVVNFAMLGWLVLWPLMLGLLARHLRGVSLAGTGGVVVGKVDGDRTRG
jgi:hypothetical protein